MFKKIFLVVVFFLMLSVVSCSHSSMMSDSKIFYTGQEINGDAKTCLTVFNKDPIKFPFITVASPCHNFIVLLPYSKTWELESGPSVPLSAKDGQYIVTVMVATSSIDTPQDYYNDLLDNMKKSGKYLFQKIEQVKAENSNNLILRYQIKMTNVPEAFDYWIWNYWVIVPYQTKWYGLHLSVSNGEQERLPSENKKIVFALGTFNPGYLDKKK